MKVFSGLLLVVVAVFSLPSWSIANDGNNLLADCEALITMIDASGQSFPTDKVAGASRCGGLMEGILQMNLWFERCDDVFLPTYEQHRCTSCQNRRQIPARPP